MIRKATTNDIDQIWKLHEDYILDINRVDDPEYGATMESRGFIVLEDTKQDILERIQKSHIFNVYEENDKILGLIDINQELYFPEDAGNIIWATSELKEKYFHNDKSTVLHYIAIDATAKRTGVAKTLFSNALDQLVNEGYKNLFSIVTTGPLTNCASIIWHTKMGFDRACVTMPIDLFGLKNYTSLLFHKVL